MTSHGGSTTTIRVKDSLPGFSRKLSAKTSDGNLWDMLAYFRGESANGQKFCDMLLRQVSLYKRNRQRPAFTGYEITSKDFTDNLKPLNHDTL